MYLTLLDNLKMKLVKLRQNIVGCRKIATANEKYKINIDVGEGNIGMIIDRSKRLRFINHTSLTVKYI